MKILFEYVVALSMQGTVLESWENFELIIFSGKILICGISAGTGTPLNKKEIFVESIQILLW